MSKPIASTSELPKPTFDDFDIDKILNAESSLLTREQEASSAFHFSSL